MNIKKMLSLTLVLAMALTVIPAFGLTAAAAEGNYRSHADGDTKAFYVESLDKFYKYTGDSVVTNGDFATGDATGWIARTGKQTTLQVKMDEELGANVLYGSTGGNDSDTSIGQEWTVEAGKTYYISFYAKGKADANNYKFNRVVDNASGRGYNFNGGTSESDVVAFGGKIGTNSWTHFETVFTATSEKITFLCSRATDFALANVELVQVAEEVHEKIDVTVTANDSEGNALGEYKTAWYEGFPVTVPAGVYNGTDGHWYLDKDTESTVITNGKATVTAAKLTAFTWETSSNKALGTNLKVDKSNTYNAGRIVYWTNNAQGVSQNRIGYTYAEVPECNKDIESLKMTVNVYFSNNNTTDYPTGIFSYVNADELKKIDINGGEATTAALAALKETEIVTIPFSDHKNEVKNYAGEISVIIDDAIEVPAGEIGIKMYDDGKKTGIAMIYNVTFTTVGKSVTVNYVTDEGKEIGSEILTSAEGKVSVKERNVYFDGKIYSIPAQDVKINGKITDETEVSVKAVVAQPYAATKVEFDVENSNRPDGATPTSTSYKGYTAVTGRNADMTDDDGEKLAKNCDSFGNLRAMKMTFNKPVLKEGQLAILHIAAGSVYDNDGNAQGDVRLRLGVGTTYAYTTSWKDKDHQTEFKPPVYGTADVTALVNASPDDTVTVSVMAGEGAVGLVDESQAAFGGIAEGYASYIEVIDGIDITVNGAADGALITKNGSKVTGTTVKATEGDVIRVYQGADVASGLAVVEDGDNYASVYTVTRPATLKVFTPEVPEITDTLLGWDAEGKQFTIDYKIAAVENPVVGAQYGIEVTADGKDTLKGKYEPDVNNGVGIITKYTNAIYEAVPTVEFEGAVFKGEPTEKEAIYSLVMTALEKAIDNKTIEGKINDEQLAAVNTVLANGGIFVDENGNLTAEAQKVMTKTDDKTIKLNDGAVALGLKFTKDAMTYAVKGEDGNITTPANAITVTEDTITINAAAAAEAVMLALESVQLEFVPTEIAESPAEGADAAQDFIPEL